MHKATQREAWYIRALRVFRRVMGIVEVQIFAPPVYQIYLTCCMTIGFNVRKEMLYAGALFIGMDVLVALVIKFMADKKPMAVTGQILFAINLLLSSGIAGQVVFSNRFYRNTDGVYSAEYCVSRLAIFIAVGCLVGVICFWLSGVLKKATLSSKTADRKNNNPMICYILFILFVGACAGFFIVLKATGNDSDSSNQWIAGFQPSELLKFAFFFFLAFVSGVQSDMKSWTLLKTVMQFGSLGVILIYNALLGEFGSILVVLGTFVLFLIVSNRNWLYTAILILVAVAICIPIIGVTVNKGNEYIEAKYTLTKEEKELLAEKEAAGTLEEGEEPYVEPESTFFTRQYEKAYWRVMNVIDVNGTDPDRLPGVREYIQTESNYQPAAALKAIGISEFVPFQAPIFHYVPVGDADYIYTSVLQCGGFLSIIVLLFAYLLLADAAFSIISSNCDMINRYLVFSMVTSILVQLFINVLGVNNFIPLTGITLPFVSRGGSSIVASMMMIAVVFFAESDYMAKKQTLADEWNSDENRKAGVFVYEEDLFRIEE